MNDSLTSCKRSQRKTLSLNDTDLPDWNEAQYEIYSLLQSITDPDLRNSAANKLSLLKFMYELEYIEEVEDTVRNYFSDSQYEPVTLGSQESDDNNTLVVENEDEKSVLMSENTFNLPDIMETLRTRLGYEENNDNSVVFNDTSRNYHMFNEFSLHSMDMPSDSENKYRDNSPEEYSPINQKIVKKVKFQDGDMLNNLQYSNSNENESENNVNKNSFRPYSPPSKNKKVNFNEPFQSMLFATQQLFANDESTFYDNDDILKSPRGEDNYCTLFQTQATFVTNLKETNNEDEIGNLFATQMPIDNSKFITASQFPVPNKSDKFFKVPALPGIGNLKKPIIPKETFAVKASCTVFESAIERTTEGINFIKEEIKKAEEDDCNFFESDHTNERKSSPLEPEVIKLNNDKEEEEDLKIRKSSSSSSKENGVFISRSDLLEVEKNEFCYNTGDVDTTYSLIEEKVKIKYAISKILFVKSASPVSDKTYIKENEDKFPQTFGESQYIDRISLQTTRLSLTIAELASLNIDEQEDDFTEFCSLIKKVRSTVKIIKTFKEQNHFDLNKFDSYGMTPLHYAVLTNKLSIVKWLIEECNHNINPHGGYEAKTPLHFAILFNRTSIIKELCSRIGIDIYAKDIYALTPMDICQGDEKTISLLSNSKRKSFIKNNYFKFMPKILVDPSLDIESIRKWKQVPLRKSYEVLSLSKITTHWITKSLAMDMIKESDALYEALVRRIYILHENSLKLILENNSIDQFNIEENRYIYFKGVKLENGKYEHSNLKEGPKSKLAMKPNLFRGCYFYLDIRGIETNLYGKLQKWIILGEGELLKDKLAIEKVLDNRRDVVPFYLSPDDGDNFSRKFSAAPPVNTFIITDKTPESWMENFIKRNALIKTSEFIKRSIRSFCIDYNYP